MDEAIQTKIGLNGNQLKLIAIIAMTVDHLAWVLFPGYSLQPAAIALHLLGRIAAPVFCFFIAEGFFYTHDLKKYILRLLLFAIPSHFAYLFCFGHSFVPDSIFNQTSVLWAFAGGLAALAVQKSKLKKHLENAVSDWHLPSDLPRRLELHRRSGHLQLRMQSWAIQDAGNLDDNFCGDVRRDLRNFSGYRVWHLATGRRIGAAAAASL